MADLMQKGIKYLEQKTFFGKSNPDYNSAVECFAEAALQFKDNQQAATAFLKAAQCYQELNSYFLSAKAYESAAQKVQNPEYFRKASDMFKIHSSPDRAAEMLVKASLFLSLM
jgi:hypothetical protein